MENKFLRKKVKLIELVSSDYVLISEEEIPKIGELAFFDNLEPNNVFIKKIRSTDTIFGQKLYATTLDIMDDESPSIGLAYSDIPHDHAYNIPGKQGGYAEIMLIDHFKSIIKDNNGDCYILMEEEYISAKCSCRCHNGGTLKHIRPCCNNNGYDVHLTGEIIPIIFMNKVIIDYAQDEK